jgi:hypothetical protein
MSNLVECSLCNSKTDARQFWRCTRCGTALPNVTVDSPPHYPDVLAELHQKDMDERHSERYGTNGRVICGDCSYTDGFHSRQCLKGPA